VAHALYRDFGLIDYYRPVEFKKEIVGDEAGVKLPKGVTVRRAGFGDFAAVAAFLRREVLARPAEKMTANRWHPDAVMMVAEQKGKIIGVAGGVVHVGKMGLDWLGFAEPAAEKKKAKEKKKEAEKDKDAPGGRELVGRAVLAALHRELWKRKVTSVRAGFWQPRGEAGLYWILRRAGYGSAGTGAVELFRVNNLAQYLDESRVTLEKRIGGSATFKEWTGAIELEASGRGARVEIDHGKVKVSSLRTETSVPRPATVRISGEFAAIERAVLGIRSCFEEYLQIEVGAAPLVNEAVKELLEVVFPRVVAE
jgi:hypothetical protein